MRKLLGLAMILLFITLLSACGGSSNSLKTARTFKAVIKASARTAEMNISRIDLTITVPYGVAPQLKTDGTIDLAATVAITSQDPTITGASGNGGSFKQLDAAALNQTQPGATYTAATAAALGQLSISAIVASGFKITDEITIHLNVAEGASPVKRDFTLFSFVAYDTNGRKVYDSTATPGTNIFELSPTLDINF